jgi:hypothetical protein
MDATGRRGGRDRKETHGHSCHLNPALFIPFEPFKCIH